MMVAAGLAVAGAGSVVMTVYTVVNFRMRRRGPAAAWGTGWVLGASGMTLMLGGWVILSIAGPHLDGLPLLVRGCLRGLGGLVLALSAVTYCLAARRVGRWKRLKNYDLQLRKDGIYQLVRHPQALALCLLAVAVGLLGLSAPYFLTLPLWLVYWGAYALVEERWDLLPAYGALYARYASQTPTLLPTLRSWRAFRAAQKPLAAERSPSSRQFRKRRKTAPAARGVRRSV